MEQAFSWLSNKRNSFHNYKARFGPEASASLHGKTIKVLVLGAEGVGKTSLIRSLLGKDVDNGIKSTVYDVYEKEFKEDYGTVRVEFTDMTGRLSFPAMERLAIGRSHVFVLVYSLDSMRSLQELERLRNVIVETKKKPSIEIPIIVVGNKMDLIDPIVKLENTIFNTVNEWCFSHVQVSFQSEINLFTLESTLIQECTLYAITNGEYLEQNHSGKIKYNSQLSS